MVTEAERLQSVAILERIEFLRQAAGVKKTVMYRETGTSASAFSQWRSGLTKPSMRSIEALADFFNTTAKYLMFGESGKPTIQIDGEPSKEEEEIIQLYRNNEQFKNMVENLAKLYKNAASDNADGKS